MSGANLQSLQALVEFRHSLPTLSKASENEVQEMILSAQRIVQDAEQTLLECRTELWHAEDALRNTEEPGYAERVEVKDARGAVAQSSAYFSEVQAAYIAFQSLVSTLSGDLIGHFENALSFLDERIEPGKHYLALSVSDTVKSDASVGASRVHGFTVVPSVDALESNDGIVPSESAFSSSSLESNPDTAASPLRGESASALPALPNGMVWVEIEKIKSDGIDSIPDNLEFNKVPKENMREMLETFENKLLPILSENKGISTNELSTIDKENATEGGSSSLRLCHDSMIGSSHVSDVIVLHSKPPSITSENHPAASTPAFESGRKARLEGQDRDSNPYRNLVGREGAANIWDQGWQSESDDTELAFTSGRHRALVAQELGWKFIPARVLGEK